ncbi:MAG: phage tail protein [Tannerellaceae bacterium]|jgi:TP901-1 family phage major tail protein|nr:phage tail protein [Tannerellaceae bacterium]
MKATELLGNDLMIFVGGKAIALATSHTLSLTAEMKSTSSKDTGNWAASIPGGKSWEMTSENVYSADADTTQASYATLVDKWLADERVEVHFGIPKNADAASEVPSTGWSLPDGSYKGYAYISSISANAPNGENATFSVTLTGTGKLSKIVPEE